MKGFLAFFIVIIMFTSLSYSQDIINKSIQVEIIEIDSLEAYYLFICQSKEIRRILILSQKGFTIMIDSACIKKIEIGETYNVSLERMNGMYTKQDLSEKIIFPEVPFSIEGRFISSLHVKPFKTNSFIDKYYLKDYAK